MVARGVIVGAMISVGGGAVNIIVAVGASTVGVRVSGKGVAVSVGVAVGRVGVRVGVDITTSIMGSGLGVVVGSLVVKEQPATKNSKIIQDLGANMIFISLQIAGLTNLKPVEGSHFANQIH